MSENEYLLSRFHSNDNIFGLLVRGVRDKCGVLVIGAFRIICLNQAKQVQQKGCKGR